MGFSLVSANQLWSIYGCWLSLYTEPKSSMLLFLCIYFFYFLHLSSLLIVLYSFFNAFFYLSLFVSSNKETVKQNFADICDARYIQTEQLLVLAHQFYTESRKSWPISLLFLWHCPIKGLCKSWKKWLDYPQYEIDSMRGRLTQPSMILPGDWLSSVWYCTESFLENSNNSAKS